MLSELIEEYRAYLGALAMGANYPKSGEGFAYWQEVSNETMRLIQEAGLKRGELAKMAADARRLDEFNAAADKVFEWFKAEIRKGRG